MWIKLIFCTVFKIWMYWKLEHKTPLRLADWKSAAGIRPLVAVTPIRLSPLASLSSSHIGCSHDAPSLETILNQIALLFTTHIHVLLGLLHVTSQTHHALRISDALPPPSSVQAEISSWSVTCHGMVCQSPGPSSSAPNWPSGVWPY
jgi:hypothetical protein